MLRFHQVTCRWFAAALLVVAASVGVAAEPAKQPVAAAQKSTGFLAKTFKDDLGTHKYAVFIPHGYTPEKKWPVILFLHGAGERGKDGILQTQYGLGPLIQLREPTFPFIVVFPQCEDMRERLLRGWFLTHADGQRAIKILEQVEKDYSIDTKREILTGWSMGGYATWEMAAEYPDRWHAVVPLSGGGNTAWAEKLKNTPIWAWHGALDKTVLPEESQKMVAALREAGASPRYTEVADIGHSVWQKAYDEDALYAWMLNPQGDPSKLPPVTTRLRAALGKPPLTIPEPPFVPGVEMPRAAHVRLGNDMLAIAADSIPKAVPREMLIGKLPDVTESTEAQGREFRVHMTNIRYEGEVGRASIQAYTKDRLNVQLGLRNVRVTIGRTTLTGKRHFAQAGPMTVVIGNRRPVWLSFDVTPEVIDRKLKFKHIDTKFRIPSDNWYITSPANVSTQGFGMTKGKVSKGLVEGLYGKKSSLEEQVSSLIPQLITQLEKQIEDAASGTTSIAGSLPVYQPRLRLWPEEVRTDAEGVSLVMGATAAALDPFNPPRRVEKSAPLGRPVGKLPKITKLQVAVAPDALGPLSELLVDADIAHVHVADTPSKTLAKLADPEVMAQVFPDLKRYGKDLEIWSEIVLLGPINVVDGPEGKPCIDASQVKFVVSIKTESAQKKFKPLAEFDMVMKQSFTPTLLKPTAQTRALALVPDEPLRVELKGGFVKEYAAENKQMDTQKIKQLLATGWDELISTDGVPQQEIPDINFGFTKMRAEEVGWRSPELYAVFGPPGIKITNASDAALVYETKGPYSGWSSPYTLEPGASHEYPVAYPMTFRRKIERGYQNYTLSPGSHSAFHLKSGAQAEGLYVAPDVKESSKETKALAASPDKG